MRYAAGIDVGGTMIKAGLFEIEEDRCRVRLRSSFSVPTRVEDAGRHILPDAAEALERHLAERGIRMEEVEAAGIDVPGAVIWKDGEDIVNRCVNLGWPVTNAPAEFRRLTGIRRVRALNDANAAAIGELYFGSGADQGARSAVTVTIGTGIGAGIIQNGQVLTGANGAAGEIGHMKIAPFDFFDEKSGIRRPSSIARTDDLERYVSASGIGRVGTAMLEESEEPSVLREKIRDGQTMTAKDIFDAAAAGDREACRITEFFFRTLGTGLAGVAAVFDPDLFIIGGGVSAAGEFLRRGLRKAYADAAFHAQRDTEFRIAKLGNDAGIYGAAWFAAGEEVSE